MKTPNLVDILAQATEAKTNASVNANDFSQATQEKPKPNFNDFGPAEEKPKETTGDQKPKGAFDEFSTEKKPDEVHTAKPQRPKLSLEDYRKQGKQCVGFVEGLNTLTLPWLYQKSFFSKEERALLKELKTRQQTDGSGETSYDEKELKLLEKYKIFEDLKEQIPFSENEIELIVSPLGDVFQKYDIQLGPEFLLISALFVTVAPRFMPLMSGLENKI